MLSSLTDLHPFSMLAILAACGLTFSAVFIAVVLAKHISTVRDPLLIWNRIQGFELLPVRIRAWMFTYAIGFANPYTRSINYRVTEVEKGKVRGVMKETKAISNPFRSVHAAALVTFGETIGALALFTLLGKKDRAILTNIQVEYVKIARGLLTASSMVSEDALRKSCISPLARELEADLAKEKESLASGSTTTKDVSSPSNGSKPKSAATTSGAGRGTGTGTSSGMVTGGRAIGNNLFVTDVLIRNANFDIVAKLALTWKTDLKSD